MAHMVPHYSDGPFVTYEDEQGDEYHCPKGLEPPGSEATRAPRGWYWRLSAPGYMDCTDWMGPERTLTDAKRALLREYEVHPDTGDELPDDYVDTPGPICGAIGCSCWSREECAENIAKENPVDE